MVELLRAAEGTPDQAASFEELKERILPMVVRTAEDGSAPSPTGRLAAAGRGLNVAYAIDNDRTIAYISKARFEQWGVSMEELHETAIDNLVARSEAIAAHAAQDEDGQVNLILFQTMDGYDASRMLLPTLHERLREHLGSPFAAGIPNRDILLCFRNDDETDRPPQAADRRRLSADAAPGDRPAAAGHAGRHRPAPMTRRKILPPPANVRC